MTKDGNYVIFFHNKLIYNKILMVREMKLKIRNCFLILFLGLILSLNAQIISSPESFLGFKVGEDYKLASWEQIVNYFNLLDESSDKIRVTELGKSTEGNPFIMAVVSSSENMLNLDEYKSIARRLAVGGISEQQAGRLSKEGKSVLLVTCGIHASEVGAAQMSMELAYKLITEQTPENREILDNVIFLLVPSFNPDGLIMVRDWYNKYLQTPYEASGMPWLYHKYTGHDNNRDAFMLTQVESQYVTKILYKDWFPQVYLDAHQMGRSGPRLFVPPFADPANPNVDPLVWRGIALMGSHMAAGLQANGHSGVVSNAMYTGWWEGAFLMEAFFHNCIGLLTEMASVNIASPVFQRFSELSGARRGMRGYEIAMNFPDPWKGGWWRLRDIVDYELTASFSLLDACATYKEELLYNIWKMGNNAVEKGKNEPPYAYIIPKKQWDTPTSLKMLDVLIQGGIEVHRSRSSFIADGIEYPEGTYVILMSQPYRAFAKDMLEPQKYPDIRQYADGPPVPPYDVAGWTLPYQMGVKVREVITPIQGDFVTVNKIEMLKGEVPSDKGDEYILKHNTNNSIIAVNRLLKDGYELYLSADKIKVGEEEYPSGTIIISSKTGIYEKLKSLAEELSLEFVSASNSIPGKGYKVRKPRFGMYKPWSASMSEGWNRWLLEKYEFEFKNILNSEMKAGTLNERYDVIYVPDIRAEGIIEGRAEGTVPPAFAKGIGNEGLANLKEFVKNGGTLIMLDSACELVIGELGLPVVNVLKGIDSEKFFCPGSILKIEVNNNHPVGFGMENEAAANFSRSPAFRVIPSFNIDAEVVAKYPAKNPLMSGWILGEKNIFNRAAVVDIPYEKGHVILIGFNVIQRAQAYGTFKILFNSIFYGASELTELP